MVSKVKSVKKTKTVSKTKSLSKADRRKQTIIHASTNNITSFPRYWAMPDKNTFRIKPIKEFIGLRSASICIAEMKI